MSEPPHKPVRRRAPSNFRQQDVARAIKAGAKEVFPVGDEHGWRIGRVVDPFGHHWEIGRPLETGL